MDGFFTMKTYEKPLELMGCFYWGFPSGNLACDLENHHLMGKSTNEMGNFPPLWWFTRG